MYPGILAWALTAHKSQGNTFSRFIADLSMPRDRHNKVMGAKDGLAYTVLSRGKTSKGVKLLDFDESILKVNNAAKTEIQRMRNNMKNKNALENNAFSVPEFINNHECILLLGHVNIRSFNAHIQHLMNNPLITTYFDAIYLTETNVKEIPIVTYTATFGGYQWKIQHNRPTPHGLAFVSNQNHEFTTISEIDNSLEVMMHNVSIPHTKLCFAALYRPQ